MGVKRAFSPHHGVNPPERPLNGPANERQKVSGRWPVRGWEKITGLVWGGHVSVCTVLSGVTWRSTTPRKKGDS